MRNRWDIHWKDYYQILQVHPTAEQEVIKAAYDRLARKYHPDVNQEPSSSQKMIDINEAFEVLGTLETRRLYHPDWLKKRRESNNYQTPPRTSTSREPDGPSETPVMPTKSMHRIPTWGKWSICVAVGLVVFAVVIPNLTSSPQTQPTKIPSPTTVQTPPVKIPTPTTALTLLPNVKIQSVTLPSDAKVSSGNLVYDNTFRLVNNMIFDVTVNWQGNSSITGDFDSGIVTVPTKGYIDITKSYYYIATGTERITYTISYNGAQLDTWSGTHEIRSPVSVRLANGTYLVKSLTGGYGELTVKNGLNLDSVALLSRAEAPKVPLLAVYVQAGSSYTITKISDGVYVLFFAYGTDWDNDLKKFVGKTTYERFEDKFDFITTSTRYTTYEVTLNPVIGGTADTQYLNADEFPMLVP